MATSLLGAHSKDCHSLLLPPPSLTPPSPPPPRCLFTSVGLFSIPSAQRNAEKEAAIQKLTAKQMDALQSHAEQLQGRVGALEQELSDLRLKQLAGAKVRSAWWGAKAEGHNDCPLPTKTHTRPTPSALPLHPSFHPALIPSHLGPRGCPAVSAVKRGGGSCPGGRLVSGTVSGRGGAVPERGRAAGKDRTAVIRARGGTSAGCVWRGVRKVGRRMSRVWGVREEREGGGAL
jgi:hypothetical protein